MPYRLLPGDGAREVFPILTYECLVGLIVCRGVVLLVFVCEIYMSGGTSSPSAPHRSSSSAT